MSNVNERLESLASILADGVSVKGLDPLEHLLIIGVAFKGKMATIANLYAACQVLGDRLNLTKDEVDKLLLEVAKVRSGEPVGFKSSLTAWEYNLAKEAER